MRQTHCVAILRGRINVTRHVIPAPESGFARDRTRARNRPFFPIYTAAYDKLNKLKIHTHHIDRQKIRTPNSRSKYQNSEIVSFPSTFLNNIHCEFDIAI